MLLMIVSMVVEQTVRMDQTILVETADLDDKEKEGEEKGQKDEVEKDEFFNESFSGFGPRSDIDIITRGSSHLLSDGFAAIIYSPPDQV